MRDFFYGSWTSPAKSLELNISSRTSLERIAVVKWFSPMINNVWIDRMFSAILDLPISAEHCQFSPAAKSVRSVGKQDFEFVLTLWANAEAIIMLANWRRQALY